MTDISGLPPRERVIEPAREARLQAATSKADTKAAFVKFAGTCEQLALEGEADANDI
jgi:hypothetical protein